MRLELTEDMARALKMYRQKTPQSHTPACQNEHRILDSGATPEKLDLCYLKPLGCDVGMFVTEA